MRSIRSAATLRRKLGGRNLPSERHPVAEEDLKLSVYLRPVLTLARPLPRDVHRGKVEHLEESLIVWETALFFVTFLS